MTSIKLTVTGAQIWASVTGVLTSGMVGIPITIEYDEAWDGLTKNLMCRCSPWGSDDGEIRTRLNVGEASTVAHEVMQQGMYLYLGVEGFRADGTLVIPTTWARCGKIEYGANTCDDPSMDPELTIWNQLQTEMEETKKYVLTPEQAVNIQAYAQEARQAAEEAKQTAKHGLYYIPTISQPTDRTLRFAFTPSITGAPTPKPVTVVLPDDEDSGHNPTDLSAILETAPDNNLLDVSAAVTSFVDSTGATVTGNFSNYIPMRMGRRYVTNMGPSEFHWFDSAKTHLSTKYYNDNPKELVPEQDGYLLIKLPADTSGSLVLEGTDIGAYRPEHKRLLPCPWAGKRCLVIADSNGQYVRPGFAELVTRDLEMVLHNISAGGQTVAWGIQQLDAMDNRFDLVLVMLGTNDQGYNTTLGTITDTSGTFYANVKSLVEKLKARYPKSLTMLLTPIKRTAVGEDAVNDESGFAQNAQGLTTEDYGRAILEVCRLYSMPCIDLYDTVDLRTEADRQLWGGTYTDGTHIGPLAHAVKIAPVVKAGILAHTPYVFPEWSDEEPDVPVAPEEPDEPVTYTITNDMTNVVTSNSAATANAGTAYTARLTAAEGYAIDTVTVVMGGADITATAYADDIVSIAAVTGNITITASATVAEEPDDGSPKLLHAYGTGMFDTALEDTVGNYDLTFWNEGHGIDGTAAMALQPGQSFTVRTKATRKATLYRTQHYIMTNGRMGISAQMKAGTFRLGLESNPNSGLQANAYVAFYYKLEDGADAVSDKIVGTTPVTSGDTVEIGLTWDAATSTAKVYQNGELIGETVTSVPLVFTGFRIQANYNSDDSAGSCPAEYVQIWRGVAEI